MRRRKNGMDCGVVRTGAPSCDFLYWFITFSSATGNFRLSRDGERIFPAPPRPVEKIYNQETQWHTDDPQELQYSLPSDCEWVLCHESERSRLVQIRVSHLYMMKADECFRHHLVQWTAKMINERPSRGDGKAHKNLTATRNGAIIRDWHCEGRLLSWY